MDMEIDWNDHEKYYSTEMSAMLKKKWTFWILVDLFFGSKRFQDFLNNLPEISPKVLTDSLKDLEEFELITKEVNEEKPRLTRYYLTEKGMESKAFIKEYLLFLTKTTKHTKSNKQRTKKMLEL